MPTEAEWEYATRAGTAAAYFWGNDANQGCAYANGYDETGKRVKKNPSASLKCDDGAAQTTAVRSYRPNAFGLYDMSGNVLEWVQDCYHENYNGAPNDSKEWRDHCYEGSRWPMLRGGSWSFTPTFLRSAKRYRLVSGRFGADCIGFRVARTLTH